MPSPSNPNPTASGKGKARRNKRKREKWAAKQQNKDAKRESVKKQEASATRLMARLTRTQTAIVAPISIASLQKTRTGLGGSLQKASKQEAARIRDDPDYRSRILKSLRPVPYRYGVSFTTLGYLLREHISYSERSVLDIRDIDGIRFGLRAFRDRRMDAHFMERFVRQIDNFVTACNIQAPSKKHARGAFAQAIFGYNHGMGAGDNVRQISCSKIVSIIFSRSHIASNSTSYIRKRSTTCCAVRKCAW